MVGIKPLRYPWVRFVDVPVNAEFNFKGCGRFKKIRQLSMHEIRMPLDAIAPDAVDLSTGHRICIGGLAPCLVLEDPSDPDTVEETLT